ncbi:MAG: DNA polymerase IV [Acidobacteria bacterium]|nr:MAG: DNA polymerase IV [Acidobacteriota bacterium]
MDATRTILHVDMDAFYAAVEQRDRPELRGRPVIVGADPRGGRGRGVVATASYEARRFGVGSAMPISQAFRACPQGAYVRPDMEKYAAVSKEVMEVLRQFTDAVEPVSIDEAFLDVTGSRRLFATSGRPATGEDIARSLKAAIRERTQLTASVGVAPSKMVAKVASDMRKPDGLVVVAPGTEAAFLAPLPVRRLWGVGPKMEEVLLKIGVRTIGELATCDPARLRRRLGTHGHDLVQLAPGIDDREVVSEGEDAKSVGQEHTFGADTADRERLRTTLLELCDAVARRLRQHGVRARTVTLKYRDEDFHTSTRAKTLAAAVDSGDALFEAAWRLFRGVHGRRKVRLLGVSASGLAGPAQMPLFAAAPPSRSDVARDLVEQRFGAGTLTRASLLAAEALRPAGGQTGGDGKREGGTVQDRKGSRRRRR